MTFSSSSQPAGGFCRRQGAAITSLPAALLVWPLGLRAPRRLGTHLAKRRLCRVGQNKCSGRRSHTPLAALQAAMPTRLRLARFGCKRRPFYRIVATDSRKWRDGKPTEYVSWERPA